MITRGLFFILTLILVVSGQNSGTKTPSGSSPSDQVTSDGNPFITISGPLPKIVRYNAKPYLVISDIEVQADQTVSIEPGVVLLFRDFTGLHVQGKLVALGNRKSPIVFTSEFDTTFNKSPDNIPNPFDWNGIYIHSGGIGTSIEFCKVLYSVYGIKSDTKYIRINPAQFRNNGKSDFTLEGKQITTGKEPYSYILDMKDASIDGVPVTILRDPLAPKRNMFRYTGLTAALGGAAGAVYFGRQTLERQHELSILSRDSEDNIGTSNTTADWGSKRDRRNRLLSYTLASGIASVIGLTSLTWTFTF
jgi:hypothetical protein